MIKLKISGLTLFVRRSGLWWAADHKGEERVAEVMEYIGLCTTRRESNQLLMKMARRPRCTENDFNWMAASKFHITPSNNNTTAATMGGNSALKWWDCLELGAVDCGTLIDTFKHSRQHLIQCSSLSWWKPAENPHEGIRWCRCIVCLSCYLMRF